MNIQQRMGGFVKLGDHIDFFLRGKKKYSLLEIAIKKSCQQNGWFTEDNVHHSLSAISAMLNEKKILKWIQNYPLYNPDLRKKKEPVPKHSPSTIGVIMPSNIPLAGFHDFFCVLMSGNIFAGKCSAQDNILLPAISEMLTGIEPLFKNSILFSENKLGKIDAVIATGSDNTARYFDFYFGKYPHIIRKNRNSAAVLSGNESEADLKLLSNDIFRYFGLGCRNVSKIFIPKNYDFNFFFNSIFNWMNIIHHNKYANNYTYNKAVYLMNKIKLWDNGFLLLKEDNTLSSPVSVLFYEYYQNKKQLCEELKTNTEKIQCIVSNETFPGDLKNSRVSFGKTQQPDLWDYADGADTMKFLYKINHGTF